MTVKRSCKNIDITDWRTVYPWVLDCILRHRNRHDFRTLVCGIGKMKQNDYYAALQENDKAAFKNPAKNIAKEATRRIKKRKLNLKPVKIREKVDKSSGKVRLIGKESAIQQVLDHIAVGAADEIWKRRLVPQQASSIKRRGQIYGTRLIRKWIRNDNRAAKWNKSHGRKYSRKCKYFVKLDIRKCYQSMRIETFLEKFRRDCGNELLLWLWRELLGSHQVDGYEGFMIGALPSQWACQYIMSFIYRYTMDLHKERRRKRMKLVSHTLIYMDDILLTGASRKDLKMAVRSIIRFAKDILGLTIKPNWHIQRTDQTPIDMMGYVVHANGRITIRPRIFLRARRIALRCLRKGRPSLRQARRIGSYKGYFDNSNGRRIRKKLRLKKVFQMAAKVVSNYERRLHESNLQSKTRHYIIHETA